MAAYHSAVGREYLRGSRMLMSACSTALAGPQVPARHRMAEVRWSDGSLRETTVLAWCRLRPPHVQFLSGRTIEWVVQLEFPDRSAGWFEYEPGALRLAGTRAAVRS